MLPVETPCKIYTGLDGKALNGLAYFGLPNQECTQHPVTVYWDAAGTQPAAQPLPIVNGYIVRAGTPANVFCAVSYSQLVKDSKGRQVFYARTSDDFSIATTVLNFLATIAGAAGSSLMGFIQAGFGALQRTTQDKLRERVSVADFTGYDRTGTTSSVAAINAALAASNHVIVPAGDTPLIDATITVAQGKCLEFKGARGNPVVNPGSYFIKKATMTTPGIILNQSALMINGGVIGLPGNTGGGIVLAQNAAKAMHPTVGNVGGVGIRVGTDAGDNSNCCVVHSPTTHHTGSHGIYVHDGSGSDANAATIYNPVCNSNGGDGVRLGHTYWTTVIGGNCEVNTGWGLYLSGNNNGGYPECRWANIIGGDFNEGNTLGAVFDASYYATFCNADGYNLPTTAPNGLQGSALRTFVGHGKSQFPSIQTTTFASQFNSGAGTPCPIELQFRGSGSVADGAGIKFMLDKTGGTTYAQSAEIRSWQGTGTLDGLIFKANNAGTQEVQVIMSPYYGGTVPGADNARVLGHPALRWSTVYAGTGAINTSDAREKWGTQDIDAAVLRAVRRIDFKQFKFNDAVTKKGAAARWHFGVIAQQVKAAFEAEGLDAFKYGLLCYDEWEAQPGRAAGNRYGVRYEELLCLKLASL